jgi:hypothetical protein
VCEDLLLTACSEGSVLISLCGEVEGCIEAGNGHLLYFFIGAGRDVAPRHWAVSGWPHGTAFLPRIPSSTFRSNQHEGPAHGPTDRGRVCVWGIVLVVRGST